MYELLSICGLLRNWKCMLTSTQEWSGSPRCSVGHCNCFIRTILLLYWLVFEKHVEFASLARCLSCHLLSCVILYLPNDAESCPLSAGRCSQ